MTLWRTQRRQKMRMSDQSHISQVLQSVADEFGVDPITIISHPRGNRNLTAARGVSAWMLQGTMSNSKLGRLLGRSSTSYVADAVSRVKVRSLEGEDLHEQVQRLLTRWA